MVDCRSKRWNSRIIWIKSTCERLDAEQIHPVQRLSALSAQMSSVNVFSLDFQSKELGKPWQPTLLWNLDCENDRCSLFLLEWPSSYQGRQNRQWWPVLLCWYLHGRWPNQVCIQNPSLYLFLVSCLLLLKNESLFSLLSLDAQGSPTSLSSLGSHE